MTLQAGVMIDARTGTAHKAGATNNKAHTNVLERVRCTLLIIGINVSRVGGRCRTAWTQLHSRIVIADMDEEPPIDEVKWQCPSLIRRGQGCCGGRVPDDFIRNFWHFFYDNHPTS